MKLPIALLVLSLTAGCTTTIEPSTPIAAPQPSPPAPAPQSTRQPVAPRPGINDKRIIIDPSMRSIINVVKVNSSTGAGGYLTLQVDVQNLRDTLQRFSYIIKWYDRNGDPLSQAISFPWMLEPHETSPIVTTSPSPIARDFRVIFHRLTD